MPRADRLNVSPHLRISGLLYQCVRVVYAHALQCKYSVRSDLVALRICLRDGDARPKP